MTETRKLLLREFIGSALLGAGTGGFFALIQHRPLAVTLAPSIGIGVFVGVGIETFRLFSL